MAAQYSDQRRMDWLSHRRVGMAHAVIDRDSEGSEHARKQHLIDLLSGQIRRVPWLRFLWFPILSTVVGVELAHGLGWSPIVMLAMGLVFGVAGWRTQRAAFVVEAIIVTASLGGFVAKILAGYSGPFSLGAFVALMLASFVIVMVVWPRRKNAASAVDGAAMAVTGLFFAGVDKTIPFDIDLTKKILGGTEDNGLWLLTASTIGRGGTVDFLGGVSHVEPLMSFLLSSVGIFTQGHSLFFGNSIFVTYLIGMGFVGLVTAGPVVAFCGDVARWRAIVVWGLVFLLTQSAAGMVMEQGHLVAVWVILGILVLFAMYFDGVEQDGLKRRDLVRYLLLFCIVAVGVAQMWFALLPIIGLLVLLVLLRSVPLLVPPAAAIWVRAVVLLGAAYAIVHQIQTQGDLAHFKTILGYEGGTADFNPIYVVVGLLGVAALVFFWAPTPSVISRRFQIVVCALLAYGTSIVLVDLWFNGGIHYGARKLSFFIVTVIIAISLPFVMRLRIRSVALIGLVFVVVLLGIIIGPLATTATRSWVRAGQEPGWLVPAVTAARSASVSPPAGGASLGVCLGGSDAWYKYFCGRYFTAMLGRNTMLFALILDGNLSDDRVQQMADSGELSHAVVLLAGPPSTSGPEFDFIMGAGQVYDEQGNLLDVHNPAVMHERRRVAVKDTRWAKPAQTLVDALLAKPPAQGVSEIICYGSDPAESSACSFFATEQLGKKSSGLMDGLVTGAEQTVLDAKAAGTLDDVVILVLDLPPKEDLLPYQKVLFASVEAVYQATPSGGLRRVPDSSW